jgi:hypothetical protein
MRRIRYRLRNKMLKLKGSGTENILIFGTGTFSLYAQEFMLLSMQDPLEQREGSYFWLDPKAGKRSRQQKASCHTRAFPANQAEARAAIFCLTSFPLSLLQQNLESPCQPAFPLLLPNFTRGYLLSKPLPPRKRALRRALFKSLLLRRRFRGGK